MSILKYIDRLRQFDQLVSLKCTGTPTEFALKLRISKRSLFSMIEELKLLEIPIEYCPYRKTYFYATDGRLKIGFYLKENTNS